jgi:hypothetical protein
MSILLNDAKVRWEQGFRRRLYVNDIILYVKGP